MYENNPTALISSSNKEIQQQTLEMVQKLSKDLYFEIDQIDQQIQRLKKRMDSNNNL